MDEDLRNKKRPFYGALKSGDRNRHSDSKMYERLPRPYDSKTPDYSKYLTEENVEKYVHFAGVIKNIPPHIDITNRTDVLRIIDIGKQHGNIELQSTSDRFSVVSLSVYNIKVIPLRNEDLPTIFLRIPMQEIAAVCYIKDDGQHILAIKHGSTELCHLTVLYCETKSMAEEICALVDQCFQLNYTGAVIDKLFIDSSNSHAGSSRSNSTGSANQFQPSYITSSLQDINHPSSRPPSIRRGRRVPSEPSDGGIFEEQLCRDYMLKLHQKLDSEELRTFASLIPELQSKTDFNEFCEKVYKLYGPERKYLLSEMSPFIPQDNYPKFEEFLRKKGLPPPDGGGTLSSAHSNPAIYSRSVSDISSGSTVANGESLEHIIRIMSDVHRLDESNDVDYNPDKYTPGPDYNTN